MGRLLSRREISSSVIGLQPLPNNCVGHSCVAGCTLDTLNPQGARRAWINVTRRSKSSRSTVVPAARSALFGSPPLIEGEDFAAYNEILVKVSAAMKPADILEDIWARDVVDLIWEALRLRRLKAALMKVAARDGLQTVLQRLDYADVLRAGPNFRRIGSSGSRVPLSGSNACSPRST